MKEIILTQGKVSLVDDEDYDYINQFKWHALKQDKGFYAGRKIRINGKRKYLFIHQIICPVSKGLEVDHIDHNGLNNQKYNLRSATHAQNMHNSSQNQSNSGKQINNTSGYKCVFWHKKNKKWFVQIGKDNKIYFLGYFIDPIEGAKTYDVAAVLLFEDYCLLNFAESRELLKDQQLAYSVFRKLYKPQKENGK